VRRTGLAALTQDGRVIASGPGLVVPWDRFPGRFVSLTVGGGSKRHPAEMALVTVGGTPVPVTVGGCTRWKPLLVRMAWASAPSR
jgi:hypothetical protein